MQRGVVRSERFIAAVEKVGGTALLDNVWETPANLPSILEIRDPELWIRRLQPAVA